MILVWRTWTLFRGIVGEDLCLIVKTKLSYVWVPRLSDKKYLLIIPLLFHSQLVANAEDITLFIFSNSESLNEIVITPSVNQLNAIELYFYDSCEIELQLNICCLKSSEFS